MGCWKWFNSVLKEAEVEVTDKNKEKVDGIIHKYISCLLYTSDAADE